MSLNKFGGKITKLEVDENTPVESFSRFESGNNMFQDDAR
jgi:hypothetical protein